ncbi:VOC family protein [Paenibacillus sp.]|uniref:VOC family protein n=1 Tax=Paenibacillus sp. TaxID=58172 RepID=UPI002810F8B5|nr:VOC family protein [Paenibacillus sp.]
MGSKRMDHVGIMVANMDVSIRFYTEVVGLRLKDRFTHTNGVIELAFLGYGHEGETELELIQGYSDKLPAEGKVHHAAFAVDDVEAEFGRLKASEVRLIDTEITTLPNGYRYFFFYGPDGEWIEFFQRS